MARSKSKYLNGKRNGKVKEYDDNGKIKFEGEYLNWKKMEQKRKRIYRNGLNFDGEYLNVERNGKLKE